MPKKTFLLCSALLAATTITPLPSVNFSHIGRVAIIAAVATVSEFKFNTKHNRIQTVIAGLAPLALRHHESTVFDLLLGGTAGIAAGSIAVIGFDRYNIKKSGTRTA
jgi:uncharacterized membrane protein